MLDALDTTGPKIGRQVHEKVQKMGVTESNGPERVQVQLASYKSERQRVTIPDSSRICLVDPEHADRVRRTGQIFWLSVERTYGIFVCDYAALFAIPSFTNEALARQPARFTRKKLPMTVRLTSSFILDAFGYDRRTNGSANCSTLLHP